MWWATWWRRRNFRSGPTSSMCTAYQRLCSIKPMTIRLREQPPKTCCWRKSSPQLTRARKRRAQGAIQHDATRDGTTRNSTTRATARHARQHDTQQHDGAPYANRDGWVFADSVIPVCVRRARFGRRWSCVADGWLRLGKWFRQGAVVSGLWTNQPVVRLLFENMGAPAHDAAGGKSGRI